MMSTIYVLSGFNNYYNRVVKRFETIDEYQPYVHYSQENYNFVPNDEVNAQVVLGSNANMYGGAGDYLLVVSKYNEIVYRWFIIESVRDRAGQYTLTLHRDLVADRYNEIIDAPMFIEKATLPDSDPMIYNSEGISVNQIKTNEYVLRDKTRCAWIVGYLDRSFLSQDDSQAKTFLLSTSAPIADFVISTPMHQWEYANISPTINSDEELYFDLKMHYQRAEPSAIRIYYSAKTQTWGKKAISTDPNSINYKVGFSWGGNADVVLDRLNSSQAKGLTFNDALKMYQPDAPSVEDVENFNELANVYNNSVIQDSTGASFTVSTVTNNLYKTLAVNSNIYLDYVVTVINNALDGVGSGSRSYYETYTRKTIYPIISAVTKEEGSVTIPKSANRVHLVDAPYDIFCIPCNMNDYTMRMFLKGYSGEPAAPPDDRDIELMSYSATLGFMQDLARQLGTNLFDIQLLPFCPISGFEFDDSTNTLRFDNIFYSYYSSITTGQTGVGNALFWVTKSEGSYFSNELELIDTVSKNTVQLPLPLSNKKLSNECDMYRLCSPNYNGQFQFTASKIEGITGFNVDYTYLPYSPYIKVSPNFAGLYGQDFDDARGLICLGDFSISYLSDAWVNYQVQNKNYLNTFNRGTENLELTHEIQRKQQVFNAITGTMMGGAGGALAGSKGGLGGAIAGGIIGTAASAIGGIKDVQYGDMLRSEALDYRQDLFNYQLDNIQALPDSIAKVTAYTKNNKVFPILEYYTCTETEKKAIANKIAWNGMTVMRIGTMSEFIGNTWSYDNIESKGYIKGKLIRLDEIGDDYHIVNALSGELDKGVYIK